MAFTFWKTSSPRIKRILTILAFFLVSAIITIAGILTPLSSEEANAISQELEQLQQNISVQFIFGNNFMICLAMFVPIAGPIFGFYVLYNTGIVIAAESMTLGLPPLLTFSILFIYPFTWLEFLAYSTALAESFWLIQRVFQHRGKRELVNTLILIAICAIMLVVAAIIEMLLITMFT